MPNPGPLLVLLLSSLFLFCSDSFGQNVFASQITQVAALTNHRHDQFGAPVSMSTDAKTIVVGDVDSGVYVFAEPPGGWTTKSSYVAELRSPRIAFEFGLKVAISGDGNTIVVGAPGTNEFEGEVFVYVKPKGGWQTTSKFAAMLSASDITPDGLFGMSIAIQGDTIVVSGNQVKGYLFVRPRNGWKTSTETAQLIPSDGNLDFGTSLAIEGTTVVAGAGSNSSSDPGKVYLFKRPGLRWTSETETAQLAPSNGTSGEAFGFSVAVDPTTVVVGANDELNGPGAAYVFVKPSGGWSNMTETAELTGSDTVKSDSFGNAVAINRGLILAGAPNGGPTKQGAVYVYDKPESGWTTTSHFNAKLIPPSRFQGQIYGVSIALSPRIIVVGANQANDPNRNGVAYVYKH
jgi:hypothetical protein